MVGQELQVVLTELKLHGELQVDLRVEAQTHRSELQFTGWLLTATARMLPFILHRVSACTSYKPLHIEIKKTNCQVYRSCKVIYSVLSDSGSRETMRLEL